MCAMHNVMIFTEKEEKEEIINEEFHITINIFLGDKYYNIT